MSIAITYKFTWNLSYKIQQGSEEKMFGFEASSCHSHDKHLKIFLEFITNFQEIDRTTVQPKLLQLYKSVDFPIGTWNSNALKYFVLSQATILSRHDFHNSQCGEQTAANGENGSHNELFISIGRIISARMLNSHSLVKTANNW